VSIGVAETEFGRIGLVICADTFEDWIAERIEKLAPNLMLVPYGSAAPIATASQNRRDDLADACLVPGRETLYRFDGGDWPTGNHGLCGARNESENVPEVGSFCAPGPLPCVRSVRLDLSLRLLGPPRRLRCSGPGGSLHQ